MEASLKKTIGDYLFLLVLAGIIVAADQWTKDLVRTNLALSETWSPWEWLAPYVRIVHWRNTGAAFGLGQNLNNIFKGLAVVVAIAIIYYFPKVPRQDWVLRVAMGMQLGGALGNFIDRITIGHVTDFVSLGIFPVFNVADASISTGCAILIVGVWVKERILMQKEKAIQEADQYPEPPGAMEELSGE